MRIIGKRKVAYGKRPDYKKAFVTFDETLVDVGMGSVVDGLPTGQMEGEEEEGGEQMKKQQQQQQIEA
eukprot:scaffold5674_cov142-Skeletonema_menzelii.AAC.6